MSVTKIEWVRNPDGTPGHTVNPIRFRNKETGKVGHYCEKISAGCRECYASKMQKPYLSGLEFIAENKGKGELFLEEAALIDVLLRQKPTSYFWCDMTDLFGSWVPDEWIGKCFGTMAEAHWHRHMVLTKRAVRLQEWSRAVCHYPKGDRSHRPVKGWPPNVWVGVSVEDRVSLYRIDYLRETPAALRFLSLEPLLEDLGELDLRGIGWVIVGGESGPGARPCDVGWIRSVVRRSRAAGVPVFVKQVGSFPIIAACRQNHYDWGDEIGRKAKFSATDKLHPSTEAWRIHLKDRKGGDMAEWAEEFRVRELPAQREGAKETR